jgi:hypothetical protein
LRRRKSEQVRGRGSGGKKEKKKKKGQGPWQRRLEEIGGIKPLAFGQFGEMGPGLEKRSLL